MKIILKIKNKTSMTKLLKQSGFCRFLLATICVLTGFAGMAQVTVKGKVTGENGAGISNASVQLEPSNAGANTDASGNYTITAKVKPGKYTLVFSSVGFKRQTKAITVSGNDAIDSDVSLAADPLGLDEVVVTGTTVATSKRRLGNSISIVSARDIQNSGATSIDGALQGKVVGAQVNQNSGNPAGGISVILRGVSTLGGSSEPLYILDGVIINNDSRQLVDVGGGQQNRLVDLNPADIDRIEVIKGASAAAIYGSRANNGVVQIFTKKGKEGKATVTFSTQIKTSSIRKKLEVNKVPFVFKNPNIANDFTTIPVTRYDYQDDIFRKAMGIENNLSVSGGTSQTKYYLSLSNLYNQGILGGTDFNRSGLRLNLDQKINKFISISAGANYSYSISSEIPNGGIAADYGALTGFIFASNYVDPKKNPSTGVFPNITLNSIVKRTNPLEAIERFDFKQRTNRFIANASVKIKPLNGLSVDYNFGLDSYNQLYTAFIPVDNTTATKNNGYSRKADANVAQINHDFNATYRTKILDWLQSTTTIGGTIQYDKTLTSSITADNNLAPFGQTVNVGIAVANEDRNERSYWGNYIQQSFDIDNRLFLTGAIRSDASSVFGKDNRNQLYPKVSGSYILSNEKFWNDKISKYVSSVKFRAAWGKSGNLTAIGPFDRFTNFGPTQYNASTGYFPSSRLGNESIKPEQQTEFEIGTDISLFNDRVSVEFNYYKKDVKDLILDITLAPGSGYSKQLQNIGNLTNKGIEFLIRAIPVKTKNFTWVSTFSYNKNDNNVSGIEVLTDRLGARTGGVVLSGDGFGRVASVNGSPAGAFYAGFYARNPDGTYLLTPAGLPQREQGVQGPDGTYTIKRVLTGPLAGQPTGGVLNKVLGSPLPKQLASFINEVNYKKLSFRIQFDGAFGFDVFNFNRRVGEREDYGGLAGYEKELNGTIPRGTGVAQFNISEEFIEKGDYIKLRELSVGYDWKPKITWVQNVRFNLSGRNLASFDNYSGYDPEINVAGQSNTTRGFDFAEVPLPRSFAFGINVTF
jgi:TonB-dependent starch-binding outer membrane protein SusC